MPETNARLMCSAPGCDRSARYLKRQLCSMHYKYLLAHGTLVRPYVKRYSVCTIHGCGREPVSTINPYCQKHYYRFKTHGTTDLLPPLTPEEFTRRARERYGVDYAGERLLIQEWAERVGITAQAMGRRLANWTIDRAMNQKAGRQGRQGRGRMPRA